MALKIQNFNSAQIDQASSLAGCLSAQLSHFAAHSPKFITSKLELENREKSEQQTDQDPFQFCLHVRFHNLICL